MTKFEALFGIKASQIRENCILMPVIPKGVLAEFKINNLARGKLYSASSNDNFTLVHTKIGPGFTGDAVLWLKKAGCKNIILFGSCGAVRETKDLTIGSFVVPVKCFSNESFTVFLKKHGGASIFHEGKIGKNRSVPIFLPDKKLLSKLISAIGAKEVNCSSIPSLKLEESMAKVFIKNKIDVVEMECSACFAAAKYAGIKAAALFYVSDVINKYPFYRELAVDKKEKLSFAIKTAASALCQLIKTNLNV